MSQAIDVRAELRSARGGRLHRQVALLMGAVLFFDGYDLFNAGYVAPYVRAEWQLAPAALGVLLSAGIAGLALGSLIVGRFADRYGRRTMLLAALWTVSATTILLATFARTFESFVALRFALGFGLGMVTPLALTYLNEWAPQRSANRFATGIFIIGFAGGGIAAGMAGIFLAPAFGWRSIYAVGALSILVALACYRSLPESIEFLAEMKRWDEVRSLLGKLHPDRVRAYEALTSFVASDGRSDAPAGRQLRDALLSRTTAVIWMVGALSLFCIHGLTNWLPTVMIGRGASTTLAFSLGTLIMVMQVLGGLASAAVADRLRRRKEIMAVGFLGGGIAMLGFSQAGGFAAMAVLLAAASFCIFGAQAVLNNFTALSYAPAIRGSATGIGVGVARIGGILGPIAIGMVQSFAASFVAVFALLAAALLVAAALIMLAGTENDGAGG